MVFLRSSKFGSLGREMRGRVVNVVLRGEEVLVDGHVVAQPGIGRNVRLVPEVLSSDEVQNEGNDKNAKL